MVGGYWSKDGRWTGIILHYNGRGWKTLCSDTGYALHNVWGSSPSDVFVVGYEGVIQHYDGKNWTTVLAGITSLSAVWGSSSSDVFAVGEYGAILHYSGPR